MQPIICPTCNRLRQDLVDPPPDVQEKVLKQFGYYKLVAERDRIKQNLEDVRTFVKLVRKTAQSPEADEIYPNAVAWAFNKVVKELKLEESNHFTRSRSRIAR